MNATKILAGLFAGAAVTVALPTFAAMITDTASFQMDVGIRDNDLNGVADTRTFHSRISAITDVQVTLNVAGGYNGDLYVYLTHGSGFAVLLNRVGSSSSNPFGYSDSGFDVIFMAGAVNGDIHNYQSSLDPLGGSLTGIWQPDGRNAFPADALGIATRSALLDSFNGLDASGDWTLYLADASPVGTSTLRGWGLSVTGTPVPEPSTILAGALLLLPFGAGVVRTMRRRGVRP
jgi:subtilisin-like proprotein convertase family protein